MLTKWKNIVYLTKKKYCSTNRKKKVFLIIYSQSKSITRQLIFENFITLATLIFFTKSVYSRFYNAYWTPGVGKLGYFTFFSITLTFKRVFYPERKISMYCSVGVSPDSWVRQWVRVHKARVRVRVHQARVRVLQVWVRVHWTRVRVRVHWTRVRVRVRVQWVRVRVRVLESNRSQSESGLSLDSWVQQ